MAGGRTDPPDHSRIRHTTTGTGRKVTKNEFGPNHRPKVEPTPFEVLKKKLTKHRRR